MKRLITLPPAVPDGREPAAVQIQIDAPAGGAGVGTDVMGSGGGAPDSLLRDGYPQASIEADRGFDVGTDDVDLVQNWGIHGSPPWSLNYVASTFAMGYDRYRMEARNITGSQNEELQRLYAALPAAIHRAAVALQTGVPTELSGRQLEDFLEKEGEVDALMRRIQEIVGKP